MNLRTLAAVASLLAVSSLAHAQTYVMDFDTDALGAPIADGDIIAEQYSAWGAHWVPDVFGGVNFTGFPFATNTDMTATSTDTGFGYDPSLGNVLHSFGGWLGENGDPNMAVFFDPTTDVTSVSAQFIGDQSGASVMYIFDQNLNFLDAAQVDNSSDAIKTLSLSSATPIGVVAFTPGYFFDWAALNDVTFVNGAAVPEPGSFGMAGGLLTMGLGAGLLRRRRNRS